MTNATFEDLERRVFKMKMKKYLKLVFLFSVVLGAMFYLINNNILIENFKKEPLHVNKIIKEKVPQKIFKVKKVKSINQALKIEEKSVLKKIQYDTIVLSPNLNLPNTNKVMSKDEMFQTNNETLLSIKNKKIILHVKVVKSEDALLERFRAAGNFESAVGLADFYFEKENFEKSIYWSKKASTLKSGDSSAWLIYAKSKQKLGNKDDAIKALQLYLEYYSSEEVKRLLELYRSKK